MALVLKLTLILTMSWFKLKTPIFVSHECRLHYLQYSNVTIIDVILTRTVALNVYLALTLILTLNLTLNLTLP